MSTPAISTGVESDSKFGSRADEGSNALEMAWVDIFKTGPPAAWYIQSVNCNPKTEVQNTRRLLKKSCFVPQTYAGVLKFFAL